MATTTRPCSVCCEDKHSSLIILVDVDEVCSSCFEENIKPMFLKAIKYESCYPVRWGKVDLRPHSFARYLPGGFVSAWNDKEKEYLTMPADRIVCQHTTQHPQVSTNTSTEPAASQTCGHFFGPKAESAGQTFVCPDCSGLTCGTCAESIIGNEKDHSCQSDGAAASSADTFQGFKRGVDYQVCPKCGLKATLRDGCNHIKCTTPACRAQFCYICGELAAGQSGHWGMDKPCPRYNAPGTRNALHDPPPPPEMVRVQPLDPHPMMPTERLPPPEDPVFWAGIEAARVEREANRAAARQRRAEIAIEDDAIEHAFLERRTNHLMEAIRESRAVTRERRNAVLAGQAADHQERLALIRAQHIARMEEIEAQHRAFQQERAQRAARRVQEDAHDQAVMNRVRRLFQERH